MPDRRLSGRRDVPLTAMTRDASIFALGATKTEIRRSTIGPHALAHTALEPVDIS
jgi:hypothetical protein